MLKTRTYLAVAIAALSLALLPTAIASAQTADEVLDSIDKIVHHWQDGETSAEEALEEIETLIHSVPATERTGLLPAIDEVVHHAEEGEIEPEAAMAEIEAIVHGAGGADHGGEPTPATTGNAGPLSDETNQGIAALVALTALGVLLGAGRRLTRTVRQ